MSRRRAQRAVADEDPALTLLPPPCVHDPNPQDMGMATPTHTPEGRGYDSSLMCAHEAAAARAHARAPT